MDFAPTAFAKRNPAINASYYVSLFEMAKSSLKDCLITSPCRDTRCIPTPAPCFVDELSTLSVQLPLSVVVSHSFVGSSIIK